MDSKTFVFDIVKSAAIYILHTPHVLTLIALGLGLAFAATILERRRGR